MRYGLVLAILLALRAPAASGADNARVEQEIRRLDEQRIAAILAKDTDALHRLMADDFTYTHQGGVTEGKAAFLAEMTSGAGAFTSLQMSDVKLRVVAGAAILTGRCDLTAVRQGRSLVIPMHFTEVYLRRGGRWRWFLWQSTRLPERPAP
ncbi:MAG: nuclear transport factor 2 family protein [Acidobacteriota bacterium]